MKKKVLYSLVLLLLSSPVCATSFWADSGGNGNSMFSDHKARSVGDIVTVLIEEESSSSKNAQTSTNKSTETNGTIDSVFFPSSEILQHNEEKPLWKWNSDSTYSGGGSSANKSKITAKLSATIIDVQPNGNMVIEGRRRVKIAASTQLIILTGVIRPRDISGANTIGSTAIADMTVEYVGTGDLSANQNPGLITRMWNWVNIF